MDWLLQLVFEWLRFGGGGTKLADAGEKYLLPVLMMLLVGCLIVLLVFVYALGKIY